MKKNLLYLFTFLLIITCATSCGDDDDDAILTVSTKKVSINIDSKEVVKVTGSNNGYRITSSDEAVVTTELEKNKISITGHKEGNAIITVEDKTGQKATITVEVIGIEASKTAKLVVTIEK